MVTKTKRSVDPRLKTLPSTSKHPVNTHKYDPATISTHTSKEETKLTDPATISTHTSKEETKPTPSFKSIPPSKKNKLQRKTPDYDHLAKEYEQMTEKNKAYKKYLESKKKYQEAQQENAKTIQNQQIKMAERQLADKTEEGQRHLNTLMKAVQAIQNIIQQIKSTRESIARDFSRQEQAKASAAAAKKPSPAQSSEGSAENSAGN